MSWLAAAVGAVGVVGSILGVGEARKGRKAAESQAEQQYELGMGQLELGKEQLAFQKDISAQQLELEKQMAGISAEQWQNYKTKALPLLDELAGMRTDMTAERTARAAGDVKSAFATGRESFTRALERTRSPADPGYGALLAPTYMDEASAVSQAVDDARQAERERAFERTAQAVQGYQALPSQAIGAGGAALSSAANRSGIAASLSSAAGNRAAQMFQLGNQSQARANAASQNAAQAVYGGTSLALQGLDWYRRGNQQPDPTGYNPNAVYYGQNLDQPDYGAGFYGSGSEWLREGGRVRGPGTGTSDSIPAMLSRGEFVIPADVVKTKGTEFFNKLLERYHRPVKSNESYANGGPVKERTLPKLVDDAIFRSIPTRAMSRSRR